MMAQILDIVVNVLSIRILDSILQEYRKCCDSNEEFSLRMREFREFNQPREINQYYFDQNPVFYSKHWLEKNTFNFKIFNGYWRNNEVNDERNN
jgi:hypothetical protein